MEAQISGVVLCKIVGGGWCLSTLKCDTNCQVSSVHFYGIFLFPCSSIMTKSFDPY